MRLRKWLAIAFLFTSSLGVVACLGVAGDFVFEDGDASSDDQFAPRADSSPKPDGAASRDAAAEEGRAPESEASAPDDATDGEAPDGEPSPEADAGPCVLTGPCDAGTAPGPCSSPVYVCPDGGPQVSICEMTLLLNGTSCDGGAPSEPGASDFCFEGGCNACSPGVACPAAQPCLKSLTNCDTGRSVCVDAGIQPDNTPCGTDGGAPMYCNAGTCSACLQGSSCTTKAAPCNQGSVTACTNGNATCTAETRRLEAGVPCGQNLVCNASGNCVACTANLPCTPQTAATQCHLGLTSCATGASVCTDTLVWAPDRTTSCSDGNACTVGDVCLAGKCHSGATNTCPATDQCHSQGKCQTSGVCTNPSKTNDTSCNADDNACTSDTCQSGVCNVGDEVSCNSPGPCFKEPGACTNKVTGQCSYTSVVCTKPNQCQQDAGSCIAGACQYPSLAQGYTPPGAACTCDGQGNCVLPTAEAGDTE